MAWRQYHPLAGINALCGAVSVFAEARVRSHPESEWRLPPSPLSDLERRPFFIGRGEARKLLRYRRTMPMSFRARCVDVFRVMIAMMDVRPLTRGEFHIGIPVLMKKTLLSEWQVKRIIRAGEEAGLIKTVRAGRRGRVAFRKFTADFMKRLSRTITKALNEDAVYLRKKRDREEKNFALSAPAAAAPTLSLPKPEEPPPPKIKGFARVGDIMRNIWGGK